MCGILSHFLAAIWRMQWPVVHSKHISEACLMRRGQQDELRAEHQLVKRAEVARRLRGQNASCIYMHLL